jgi:3-oxoacyl-(acyl-carrier-protein) synthase
MTERVVAITGIGTLTPAGRGTEALWSHLTSGHTCIRPIDPHVYFDPSKYACQEAGQVAPFSEPRVLMPEMMAQTDRYSQMALVAVLDALDRARLPTDFRVEDSPVRPERVALTVATVGAGWGYVEHEMQSLWTGGIGKLDRYGLTAGFPAGAQGHISIFFGVQGRTRTFISERAAGAHALIEGAKAIQRGDAEIVIAGGTEAPLTPLSWAAYQQYTGTGMHLGEGSTFLVLEEVEHARRRGIPLLAEIRGWSRGTNPSPLGSLEGPRKRLKGRGLAQAIYTALAQADVHPSAIDVLLPAGPALAEEDAAEQDAISSVFDRSSLPIVRPKMVLGHLLGAATATDVAVATLAIKRQTIPSAHDTLLSTDLRHTLILAGGSGGMHACLVLAKPGMI